MEPSDYIADPREGGRRVYIGNLIYSAQPQDIDEMLLSNGFDGYEKIHMSIDPVSARNPGYCFVDFFDREDASRALKITASIHGREVRVGPCEQKKKDNRGYKPVHEPTFKRWGDWDGQRSSGDVGVQLDGGSPAESRQGPYKAQEHHTDVNSASSEGRRLYVGGLNQMIDQSHNNDEMRELFTDFNLIAIGKRITPHESTRNMRGNHHYCFVDFETAREAEAAADKLNGTEWQGAELRVRIAHSGQQRPRNKPAAFERDQEQGNRRPRATLEDKRAQRDRQESIRNLGSWR